MALSSFNPLTIFNDLRDHGMPEPQAEAVVRSCEHTRAGLAIKEDIDLLRAEMAQLYEHIDKLFWRGMAFVGTMILAATGIIIGAIAAFGS